MAEAHVYGYAGKFLRADLTLERLSDERFNEETLRKYIGGTGIGTKVLYDEVPPKLAKDTVAIQEAQPLGIGDRLNRIAEHRTYIPPTMPMELKNPLTSPLRFGETDSIRRALAPSIATEDTAPLMTRTSISQNQEGTSPVKTPKMTSPTSPDMIIFFLP